MAYVCAELSEPDLNNVQTCITWQKTFTLPDLTPEQAYDLGFSILYVCAAAFAYKLCAILIKKFI